MQMSKAPAAAPLQKTGLQNIGLSAQNQNAHTFHILKTTPLKTEKKQQHPEQDNRM